MARRRSRTRSRTRSSLLSVLLLLAGLSIVQYSETGSLQWPAELLSAVERIAGGAPQQAAGTDPVTGAPLTGVAVDITDGDTFTLRYGSLDEERVRLHGIDAPERDQPHGPAAGAELARLIEGRTVRVELMDRDNYGRLVARVWIDDLDINLALVEGGHAWWYESYARDRRDLELAEEAARRAQRGLWAQRNPVPPWEWRRNRR